MKNLDTGNFILILVISELILLIKDSKAAFQLIILIFLTYQGKLT